jgi:hypothetical protein
MIPNVMPVSAGSVTSALSTMPTEASRKRNGTSG